MAHELGVSCEPELLIHKLQSLYDKFVIFGAEASLEYLINRSVVGTVSKFGNPLEAW